MKTRKVPMRRCIGCMESKPKKELIRIVADKDNEGEVILDATGKAQGRGAYLCDNIECLEKAIKTKRLERTFEVAINGKIYEDLRGEMLGNK